MGYEFKGKKPAGRCVLEEHNGVGKLTLWAQDVRPETRYNVLLIFNDGGRYAGVSAGLLAIDAKGKGEMRRDIEKVQLHGFTVQEVVAVAVIAGMSPRVESPLCGYRGEAVAWRKNFYEKTAAIKPETKLETKLEIAETIPTPIPPEPVPPEPEPLTTEAILSPEEKEALLELFPIVETAPTNAITNPGDDTPLEVEMPSEPIIPIKNPKRFTPPPDLSALRPISPFAGGSNAGIKWARFTLTDNVPAPDDKPDLFNEAFVRSSYDVYAHFIFGIASDEETTEYVIGVPGRYSATQQAQAEQLGFNEFKCYEDTPPAEDEFGYWLMFVG
jgi:hypothetical protein